jgi:hypothetical protein
MQGTHDYVMEWGKNVNVEEVLRIGDSIQIELQGLNVMFKIETV